MQAWVAERAAHVAARVERDLPALVAVSSPSGDVRAAEEVVAVAAALVPETAEVHRIRCSSPEHAPDLLVTMRGRGERRALLLGHLDTVVGHDEHRALGPFGDRLVGSGSVDMKGGVAMAIGLLHELAGRGDLYRELALLLVVDEEWRTAPFAHAERFAAWDACLCFEAGQLAPDGEEAAVVARKAAGAVRVRAHGRAAHAGSAPDKGANALVALAAVATRLAALHAPEGPDRLTVVPSVLRSGEALNVVPAAGELLCDVRATTLAPLESVLAAVPAELDGVRLEAGQVRAWPGMDSREAAAPVLARGGEIAGRTLRAGGRGGASDASHFASAIPVTIDGLGPRGGAAHHPDEYVSHASLRPRAEVALGVALAALGA